MRSDLTFNGVQLGPLHNGLHTHWCRKGSRDVGVNVTNTGIVQKTGVLKCLCEGCLWERENGGKIDTWKDIKCRKDWHIEREKKNGGKIDIKGERKRMDTERERELIIVTTNNGYTHTHTCATQPEPTGFPSLSNLTKIFRQLGPNALLIWRAV